MSQSRRVTCAGGQPGEWSATVKGAAVEDVSEEEGHAARVEAHFEDEVHLQRLVSADQGSQVEVLVVFFSPGSCNRPHTHEHDQSTGKRHQE